MVSVKCPVQVHLIMKIFCWQSWLTSTRGQKEVCGYMKLNLNVVKWENIFIYSLTCSKARRNFSNILERLADKFFKIAELLPLKKKDTNYCKPISPAERLAVTPPFLTERNHSPPSPFGISQNLPRWAWKFGTLAFDVPSRTRSDPVLVSHKIKCIHFKLGGRCRFEPADSVLIQFAPCLKRPKI